MKKMIMSVLFVGMALGLSGCETTTVWYDKKGRKHIKTEPSALTTGIATGLAQGFAQGVAEGLTAPTPVYYVNPYGYGGYGGNQTNVTTVVVH